MYAPANPDRSPGSRRTLADGSTYLVRSSGEADRQLVIDCFDALSPDSRRLRFFNSKQSLSPAELDFFTGADGRDHIACVAVRLDHRGEELEALGFARCVRLSPGADCAEFSITVADQVQGQGLGSALLDHLVVAAGAVGIRRLRCEVLAENAGMRNLAQHLGGEPRWLGDGIVEYDCELPRVPVGPDWELPWYLDPRGLVSACADTWMAGFEDTLILTRTTRQGFEQWLGELCPGCAPGGIAA